MCSSSSSHPLLAALVAALGVAGIDVRASAVGASAAATEQTLSGLVRRTILENLPREFAGDNDWGQKREVASGLKFQTGGGRLRISKRTKEVNDGLWTNYHVTLVDPAQHLRVHVADFRRVGPGRVALQIFLSARLDGEARYERWRRGIKMLNFKADAQSTVEAALDCEVGLRLVPGWFLGDLVVEPKVKSVRLSLVDIDLARVSRIDGPAAEELGDRLRHALDRELRGRQDEIAQKLNEAAQKNPERLRFSTDKLLALGWGKAQELFLALAKPAANPEPH
jgi:hypothetical protein